MSTDLIVKGNALINASYNLELSEQRLILLSIVKARETGQGITSDSRLSIHASDYMSQFGVDKSTAYGVLKDAVENLFNRYFSFKEQRDDGTEFVIKSRWVSRIAYAKNKAILEVTFSPDVVPFITRLEERFTSYQLQQVTNLSSKYSVRLYELLIAWRELGKVPEVEITEFRNRLGVEPHEYKQMGHFKDRVLEPSIKQINEHTDIIVSYTQHKTGRTITGFSFKFKLKDKPKKVKPLEKDLDTIDMFYQMTDAEIHSFGNQLSRLSDLSFLAKGNESYESLASKIKDMLRDEQEQIIFIPHLKNLGFKFRKR